LKTRHRHNIVLTEAANQAFNSFLPEDFIMIRRQKNTLQDETLINP